MRSARILVEGLSAFRAVDKLAQGGVEVLSAQKTQKNGVFIDVPCKDLKKVFAILRTSCYNIKRVRFLGIARLLKKYRNRTGLLAGALAFVLIVSCAQTRVLKIDVVGSGAYYRVEVCEILARAGVKQFSGFPQNSALLSAEILSLPRVSYCAFRQDGGVLTVEVEISDERAPLAIKPLLAPVAGEVISLTVVRGRSYVEVGSVVAAGDTLVDSCGEAGEQLLVIASAELAFSEVADFAANSEQSALARARLCYPEAEDLRVLPEGDGWRVEGRLSLSLNMK